MTHAEALDKIMPAGCKCVETSPTYPTFRATPHLPGCPLYQSPLAGVLGITDGDIKSMAQKALFEVSERRVRAVQHVLHVIEIICRDHPCEATDKIRYEIRHHTRLFPDVPPAKSVPLLNS